MELVASILIIIMSIAHIIYGEIKQLPEYSALTEDSILIGSVRVMIYQGGVILLAVGITQLLHALTVIQLEGIGLYFPVGIVVLNFLVSLLIILIKHTSILKVTVPQFVVFGIIIVLLLLF